MKKLSRELQHIIERKKEKNLKKIIALAPHNGKNRNEKKKTMEYVGSPCW